jgi:hypothetical protein
MTGQPWSLQKSRTPPEFLASNAPSALSGTLLDGGAMLVAERTEV